MCRIAADVAPRHPQVRRPGIGLAAYALDQAGVKLSDMYPFAEVHDCFTIAELLVYEAIGLAPEGQGARVIADGIVDKDGKLPINRSGGLKAKGPSDRRHRRVDAHAIAAMRSSPAPPAICSSRTTQLGGIFNMGGAAVANYVSILERLR